VVIFRQFWPIVVIRNFQILVKKRKILQNLVKKKQVLAMFYVLFVRKNFFDPNLRGGSPEKSPTFLGKIWRKNLEKIWKNMAPW
jgi:hypothetical protein